jgi:selT/selW/selH-like putative selenoprotein
LAGAIASQYGDKVSVEQERGSGGIFDVEINGEKVFSKWDANRFPDNKEILSAIASRMK